MNRKRVRTAVTLFCLACVFGLGGCEKERAPVLSGIVEVKDVHLGFEEGGYIETLPYDVNDPVSKGDTVATLESSSAEAELKALRFELKQARYRLKSMLNSPRKEELEAANARVDVAKAAYDNADEELKRSRELFAKNVQSDQSLRLRIMEFERAKGNLEAARAEAALIEAGMKSEELEAQRMQVAALEQKSEAMRIRLEKRRLSAPFDSIVLTRNFEPREFVRAGQSVLSLANMQDCWVNIYVPESMFADLALGQKVEVRFDSAKLPAVVGTVSEIAQKAAFAPRMNLRKEQRGDLYFPVKIAVDNHDHHLKPGMIADVLFRH